MCIRDRFGCGDYEMIQGVSGATYLYVSGSSTLAGTLQSGQYILATGLAYGAVNNFTQIIDGTTGALTGTTATFSGDVTLANGNSLRWTSDDVRIEATTASDNMKFYVGASEILKLEQSGTLATFAGNITSTGTVITLDSAGSAGYIADRANDTSGATYEYKTGGSLKWYAGLRGVSTEDFYLFNNAQGSTALLINSSNNLSLIHI